MSAIWKRVKPWWIPAGLTLLVFILLRYVFLIGYVPTESMEPTLPKGSFLLGLRIFEEPKVGDIIVAVDDEVCSSSTALIAKLQEYNEGDVITVKVFRAEGMEQFADQNSIDLDKVGDGEYVDVSVTLRVISDMQS